MGPAGTLEKRLTLDVDLRVFQLLNSAGHSVRLTRDQDVNLRLRDRAKVARDFQAHAFVSIHFNGSTGHNAQGTETLVHTNHSPSSARLSLAVQDALLPVTGLTDRNRTFHPSRIKPQALGVLRLDFHAPSTAACLAEVSFLDRADQEQRLQDQSYRQRIAQGIADGIEAFTGAGTQAAPHVAPDAGDAIELAALATSGTTDVVAFLNLDSVQVGAQNPPASGTADIGERSAKPAGLFSKAFVQNTGPALALIADAPAWPELDDFVEFIQKLKLQHFSPDEFLFLGASNKAGKCKDKNSFPPKSLWPSIKNTALMLDAIRTDLGAPIRILSCYRSPDYNACIGGEDKSFHMEFNAIDFTCAEGTPEIWRRVADKLRSSNKSFLGGIGVYPTNRFVHIDTRGKIADWKGK